MLKIYNSLTFKKEPFKPITPNEVLMYVCGPTVYDSPHLGHAKSAVTFDIIRRYLKFKGFNVKMIKNYTDIDDKIINRANEKGIDFKELGEKYIKEYESIMELLNIEKDDKNPRATETIDFIITLILELIKKSNAYEENGSVYFSVKSFPGYKKLLQNIKEEAEEEELDDENNELTQDKHDRRDFALWKKAKEGEPYWESPWGNGRPGWHIECSAMVINYLGETIDIHGGGQDLKFPHHRNEISQSEAYTGKKFANFFIHNGFVNVDNEKMSKSLGNFFLVSDVAKKYDPMVIRFFLLSSHYRKSINYSLDTMNQAQKNYEKVINTIQSIKDQKVEDVKLDAIKDLINRIDEAQENIIHAMDDDFNMPVSIAEIMTLLKDLNRAIFEEKRSINETFKSKFFNFIDNIDLIFGLFPKAGTLNNKEFGKTIDEKDNVINSLLDILKNIRSKLRERKIYDISDEIRDNLRDLGFKIDDK
ncbi:MAG: cysteine--tRNA ligase [Promethearchaeota archaeon]